MVRIARGHLFVISGPSGVGKGTLRKRLFGIIKDLEYSISCTTRRPRNSERDGYDYRFVKPDLFRELEREGKFLEWAEVHGNLYGTLKKDVEAALSLGKDLVLEIDVQGALKVREIMPEAILIFIMPPSLADLEERLKRRGSESGEDMRTRMDEARHEIELSSLYDHTVVNDDLPTALVTLEKIVESYRQPARTNKSKYPEV
ncbi:MAG: guanylate kinase [Thermovirgaceae bacterium]|nr:guanylate kinase [Thermovirgaceae bacterium]